MRTIIYGAGAIGGTVGGHLARAGYDVVLIGRPGHVAAIRRDGLRFVTPTGTHTLRVPAVTHPAEIDWRPGDVVFLCVKGQNTAEALRDLQAALAQPAHHATRTTPDVPRLTFDVPLFCLQNGVRNEELAARVFARVYGVMVRVGGVYLQEGEVIARRDPPGLLIIGRYPSGADELAEAVAGQLRAAGFTAPVTPDVMAYKWGKLLSNLANAVGAITDAGGEDPDHARIVGAARREAEALMRQAGIRWVPPQEIEQQYPEVGREVRGKVSVRAGSSTWQSLARGQGSVESDFLNGEIVRLAARLGATAPVNAGLARIASEMAARREKPGRYSAKELAALLECQSSDA